MHERFFMVQSNTLYLPRLVFWIDNVYQIPQNDRKDPEYGLDDKGGEFYFSFLLANQLSDLPELVCDRNCTSFSGDKVNES
jgi:hypothetical protein